MTSASLRLRTAIKPPPRTARQAITWARRPDIASKLAVANQSFAEAALAMATDQVGEAGTLLEAGTTALGALDNLRREDYCE